MGIKDKVPLINSGSKGIRIAGYIFYAFVVLIFIGAILPSPNENVSTSIPTTTSTPQFAGILDSDSVKNMLPSDEQDDTIDVTGGTVDITRNAKENWNNYYTMRGGQIDTIKIFKAIFKDPRVKEVTVTSDIRLVNKYGQESTGVGTRYTMSRETYTKVNWDNFITDNLNDVADQTYIHPALLKE